MLGQPTKISGWPARVSQCPSIAATLAGWCASVFRPCRSPATICSGATKAAIHMAIENIEPRAFVASVAQQMIGTHAADDEGRGEVGGEHHVHQAGRGRTD